MFDPKSPSAERLLSFRCNDQRPPHDGAGAFARYVVSPRVRTTEQSEKRWISTWPHSILCSRLLLNGLFLMFLLSRVFSALHDLKSSTQSQAGGAGSPNKPAQQAPFKLIHWQHSISVSLGLWQSEHLWWWWSNMQQIRFLILDQHADQSCSFR